MQIVTGPPAPMLDHDQATRLIAEMAAVVRTIFGAPAAVHPPAAAPADQPALRVDAPPAVHALVVPVIAAVPVPSLPVPSLPLPSLPLVVPDNTDNADSTAHLSATESPDSAERRSLALLQEIAFLDD